MAGKKVTVVARIKAKRGMEKKLAKELLSIVGPTRKEVGCINYDFHQSVDNKSRFIAYENWASKKDLDRHLKTAHVKSFSERAGGLLAEPIDITLWEMIS